LQIITGSSHVDSLSFEAAELHEALAVWRSAAKGRELPVRTELTPRLMKKFLPSVAIVDVVRNLERTRFRVRLSGTALEQTFGGLSGTFLDESLPKPLRQRWEATLNVPLVGQCPARSFGRVAFRNQNYLKVETFFGPMGTSPASPDSILLVVHVEPSVALTRRVIEEYSSLDAESI
jgi:hypothetical protein